MLVDNHFRNAATLLVVTMIQNDYCILCIKYFKTFGREQPQQHFNQMVSKNTRIHTTTENMANNKP